jgi:hypothetical protein
MALVLAFLYFGLIELLMIDSSRELAEARRFRARVVAQAMAENGAELAARNFATGGPSPAVHIVDENGTTTGSATVSAGQGKFVLHGEGATSGVASVKATVTVQGRVVGPDVYIDYTLHSQ